jgi:hypothetical protein
MAVQFKMDIGMMYYFLGLQFWQRPKEIFLGQGKYAVEILKRFRIDNCKPMATPMITNLKKVTSSDSELVDPMLYMQLIGFLMYLVNTKPYICFAIKTLSQFMVEPRQEHWVGRKHVLKYLMGTVEYGLRHIGDGEEKLQGYSNSDWAGSATNSLGSTMIS